MTHRVGSAGLAALLITLSPLGAAATSGPIHLQDFRALVRIESPSFSPNGSRIAFLTVQADFAHDRYDATLRVMNAAGGGERVLVSGMRGVQSPSWSPDGLTLAFIADASDGTSQIYTVPAAGGTPVQLGHAPNGIEQFAWSPDGQTMAFVTPDASPLSAADRSAHHDLFTISDDDYLIQEPPAPSHIWLLSVRSGQARQLTRGTTSVLEAPPPFGGGVSAPSWSADGAWLVYTQQANAHDADTDSTRIVAVNVATGDEHPLTGERSYEYLRASRRAATPWRGCFPTARGR